MLQVHAGRSFIHVLPFVYFVSGYLPTPVITYVSAPFGVSFRVMLPFGRRVMFVFKGKYVLGLLFRVLELLGKRVCLLPRFPSSGAEGGGICFHSSPLVSWLRLLVQLQVPVVCRPLWLVF